MVLAILTVGIGLFVQTMTSMHKMAPLNRETALAGERGYAIVETMRSVPFAEVFARFNEDPGDDPVGVVSPGAGFDVPGLAAQDGDADGFVGRIVFPTLGGVLREDVDDDDLGMPRDLNGDASVDGDDRSADYTVLPVLVRMEWQGELGNRDVELYVTLADL